MYSFRRVGEVSLIVNDRGVAPPAALSVIAAVPAEAVVEMLKVADAQAPKIVS
jgi:hypothetical protein